MRIFDSNYSHNLADYSNHLSVEVNYIFTSKRKKKEKKQNKKKTKKKKDSITDS